MNEMSRASPVQHLTTQSLTPDRSQNALFHIQELESESPEERFRRLFHDLDGEGEWSKVFNRKQLSVARIAASNEWTWHLFLAGVKPEADAESVLMSPVKANGEEHSKDAAKETDGMEGVVKPDGTDATDGDASKCAVEKSEEKADDPEPASEAKDSDEGKDVSSENKTSSMPGQSEEKAEGTSSERGVSASMEASPEKLESQDLETDEFDIAVVSAITRRRLAMASIDEQLFLRVPSAMPVDDDQYEIDHGLMPGDDGGITSFSDLQREEDDNLQAETGVYALLGQCPPPPAGEIEEADVQKNMPCLDGQTPKRPRPCPMRAVHLHAENFVKCIREILMQNTASEVDLDGSKLVGEIDTESPAIKIVKQLKGLEFDAKIGRFETAEDCDSAVQSCFPEGYDIPSEVRKELEQRMSILKEAFQKHGEQEKSLREAVRKTTGLLGADLQILEKMGKQDAVELAAAGSSANPRNRIAIPYSEAALDCWPSFKETLPPLKHPKRPRVPKFQGCESRSGQCESDTRRDAEHEAASLIQLLGTDNPLLRNVMALKRLRALREEAIAALEKNAAAKSEAAAPTSTDRKSNDKVKKPDEKAKNPSTSKIGSQIKAEPKLTSRPGSLQRRSSNRKKAKAVNKTPPIFEIKNSVDDKTVETAKDPSETRERAITRGVCALLCAHAGFTHASRNAVDILADVFEQFVRELGLSLSAGRENIDNNQASVAASRGHMRTKTRDELREELRIICESGFKGGAGDLHFYAKADTVRVEQGVREAEMRIRQQVQLRGVNPQNLEVKDIAELTKDVMSEMNPKPKEKPGSTPVSEADLNIESDAFSFGYLAKNVRLDVLGTIRVPDKMVYLENGTPSKEGSTSGTASPRIDKTPQQSPRPKKGFISSTPVKTEASVMEVDTSNNNP